MNPWWLALIVPLSTTAGALTMSWVCAGAREDAVREAVRRTEKRTEKRMREAFDEERGVYQDCLFEAGRRAKDEAEQRVADLRASRVHRWTDENNHEGVG